MTLVKQVIADKIKEELDNHSDRQFLILSDRKQQLEEEAQERKRKTEDIIHFSIHHE